MQRRSIAQVAARQLAFAVIDADRDENITKILVA